MKKDSFLNLPVVGRGGFAMFKSAFAQECLEETRATNTSTDSLSAAMLPRERHKLYKSQVKMKQKQSGTKILFPIGSQRSAILQLLLVKELI